MNSGLCSINFLTFLVLCLLRVSSMASPIVGAWSAFDPVQNHAIAVFTFKSDGTYFEAEAYHNDPVGTHQPGMERGTYTWDQTSGAFTFQVLEDTNGDWGLSDSGVTQITIAGDNLEIGGEVVLTRVTSSTNPLVGSWSNGVAAFTALSDGTYFEAEGFHEDPGTHQPGIERGTYTWNPVTGAFAFQVLEDTNGDWGLSDSGITNVSVNGILIVITGADGPNIPFTRVADAPRISVIKNASNSLTIGMIGVLQASDDLVIWNDVTPQPQSPYAITIAGTKKFFRSRGY